MKETVLKIRLFGDSVLRKKAKAVKEVTATHRQILSQMAQLMYAGSGIGLAANQVGIEECMIVTDIGTGLYKLLNPEVIKRKGRQTNSEGCLSIPEVCIKVKRANKVVVEAQDEYGKKLEIEAEGLLACVFQHEIDHLQAKLIVDYTSFFERLKIRKKIKDLSRRAQDEGMPASKTKSCQLQL